MKKENRKYIPFDQMKECDRCGFAMHWSKMVYEDGLWLCTERGCQDKNEEVNDKEQ